jgi:hypothetical protein
MNFEPRIHMHHRPTAAQIEKMIQKSNENWLNRKPRSKARAKAARGNFFNIGTFGDAEKVKMGLLPPILQEGGPTLEET